MRCLVTGAAGFIGSNLVDKLVALGHKVVAVDNLETGKKSNLKKSINKIIFKRIDIKKINEKKNKKLFNKIDWVFHLAGLADIVPSIKNPKDYYETNVTGTLNMLELSKRIKIKKFIYAASASCYGIPKKFPTKEDDMKDPKYPYALTKLIGEQLVLHWANVYKMPNLSLRFFNVYGPRSRTSGAYGAVFGVFLAQKINNAPLTIVGNGKQTRDFIFIDDLINALINAAKSKQKNKSYNIGSGKEVNVKKIANLISPKQIYIPKRPGEPDRSLADIRRAKKDFNWKPVVSIEEGVKKLLQDISPWKTAPVWTPKKIKIATKEWFAQLKK